ncbi:fatty acid desaturase family protein [Hyalangium rubrum]|uniref:Fatty acid desaturase n=1 Tax=Hyalangium rubrum TaxID=3103134 RepID=A0ABU5GV61_9BACT|nr:fatty acid desaturase [Hyalangium sp. s54d21]MDY7224926.1 fatty acid desaturase [Hyalangium sp. s54d21]
MSNTLSPVSSVPVGLGLSRPELVELLRIRPARAVGMGVLHGGVWLLAALALVQVESLWAKVPLWLLAGGAVMGLIQLDHDAWHENLFPKSWQNRLFGNLLSLLVGIAYEPMRHDHLAHHRWNRTEKDPDAYNAGRRSLGLSALYYATVLFGIPLSLVYFNVLYPVQHFDRARLRRHVCVLLGYAVFYTGLFWLLADHGLVRVAVECWLVPVLFASPLNGLKSISDHHANVWRGGRFHTATTVRSTRLVTFLWNGLNHHLDHHLFPRVPGYNLARLHARLRPVLLAQGAPVFDSYLQVMWSALRAGPSLVDEDVRLVTLERKNP